MTDFWRVANIIIIIVIIIFIVWLQKRKKNKPQAVEPAKLDELKNRKQKLACDLKAFEDDVNQLEAASRQMMEDYFVRQEVYVNELVKEEINAALDEMAAKVEADMRQSFSAAQIQLKKDLGQ